MKNSSAILAVFGMVVTLTGCQTCGDGMPCGVLKPTPVSDTPSTHIPTVKLVGDKVTFHAPSAFFQYQHNVIWSVDVYDQHGRAVWLLSYRLPLGHHSFERVNVKELPRYYPHKPIIYGKTLNGTEPVVRAQKLKIGETYRMRATVFSYNQPQDKPVPVGVKALFILGQSASGKLSVKNLPVTNLD